MKAKLHPDCSMPNYVRDNILDVPTLSGSTAVTLIEKTPRHAQEGHARLNPLWEPTATRAGDLGSAAHAAVLEGSLECVAFVAAPDFRTKAAREERDLMVSAGRPVLLLSQRSVLDAMVNEAMDYLRAADMYHLVSESLPELTATWDEDGADCRMRLDLAHEGGVIVEYKTTADSDPAAFVRNPMRSFRYDVKAAFQRIGFKAVYPKILNPTYRFLVQEQTAPYTCSMVSLSEDRLDLCNEQVRYALGLWRSCMKSGVWPGRPTDPYVAMLDTRDSDRWDARMAVEGGE